MRNKILMTLALLLTAVTGAWADESSESFTTNSEVSSYTGEHFKISLENKGDGDGFYLSKSAHASIEALNGEIITKVEFTKGFYNINALHSGVGTTTYEGDVATVSGVNATSLTVDATDALQIKAVKVYYTAPTAEPAEPAIEVKWDPATKTGNFVMPAYDVEIAPIYAPVAKWATDGDKVLAPTAVEGIYAGTEDAIVKAGTVVEGQGTAMYFATTDAEMTAEKAAKAEGWLATLPTATGYDGAQTVYVWYYIKGADTPKDQKATAENTFNDSEICAEPIKVTVLSNKFDIQFKAANDNTIEAGKANVKVGDEAAEVKEGKLTGVKMNSKVTVTAKDGYKFRKVEVKKGGLLSIEIGGATTATIYYVEGETWAQALENHPEENSAWKIDPQGDISGNGLSLFAGDDFVNSNSIIDPKANYSFQWT